MKEVGIVRALYRYPVKSFAGEALETAALGWNGVEGDRRLAFIREQSTSGFPWLNTSRLPPMVRYRPLGWDDSASLPTHAATPTGAEVDIWGDDLRRELSEAYREPVRLVRLDRGIFDDANLSLITTETIRRIEERTGLALDVRRFRPNILVETADGASFPENEWVGRVLVFGDDADGPAMNVERPDVRCATINYDPDTVVATPAILKTVVQINETVAGVYGSTFRTGSVSVGNRVYLVAS